MDSRKSGEQIRDEATRWSRQITRALADGVHAAAVCAWFLVVAGSAAELWGQTHESESFVRVSPRDSRYFELTDGRPYIPVGFNLVGPPSPDDMQRVVTTMADSGVNYCRIWLDQPPWNIEHARSGVYDEEKAKELDRFLSLCRMRGIRVKMCFEWFRSIVAEVSDPPVKGSFPKSIHHRANGGFYGDMKDFVTSERGRSQFKAKLKWHADRYGDDPVVFAWELWNEMNAVRGPWYPWTQEMLPELQRSFPRNLAVQSLGSFDREGAREQYRQLCELPENDVLQVHRYLDLGAGLKVCHGPIDVLAADAVAELLAFGVRKPVILTETGAVKPRHTGASELYAQDRDGAMLHDMLFAPFFAGAAGPGHVWFWRQAIDRPNHWHHFQRFHRALTGVDPLQEGFEPNRVDHPDLRIYALCGKRTFLAWCRDRQNDWRTEFEKFVAPRKLAKIELDVAALRLGFPAKDVIVDLYDPWQDRWTAGARAGDKITLPDFQRSIVVRIRPASDKPLSCYQTSHSGLVAMRISCTRLAFSSSGSTPEIRCSGLGLMRSRQPGNLHSFAPLLARESHKEMTTDVDYNEQDNKPAVLRLDVPWAGGPR